MLFIEISQASPPMVPLVILLSGLGIVVSRSNFDPDGFPFADQFDSLLSHNGKCWLFVLSAGDSGHHEGEDKLYPIVEETMASHWERLGSHALFHHLSALWGYKPLAVKF